MDEACKQFILDNMDPVYSLLLKDSKIGFKNGTCRQMINYLIWRYPPSE